MLDLDTPRPMDPVRVSQLRYKLITSQFIPADFVADLICDRAWHRARVQVTDDDIRASGLGDPDICEECPRLVEWIACAGLHVVRLDNDDWHLGTGQYPHGIWSGDPRINKDAKSIVEAAVMAHDWIINALAAHVCKAPLDVLEDIAETEVIGG